MPKYKKGGYRRRFKRPPKYGRHYGRNQDKMVAVDEAPPSPASQVSMGDDECDLETAGVNLLPPTEELACGSAEWSSSHLSPPEEIHPFEEPAAAAAAVFPVKPCEIIQPKLRALSLFDGLSTGYYILTKCLGLEVAAYFSSEIDPDAIRVQVHNFGGQIGQLGDVRLLSEERLAALGHIDLVIGGSPCDQLSRVNWRRKGLDDPSGSGVLFYEYIRILDFFKKQNSKLYWFFENTFKMDNDTKVKISRALGCEPVVRCASSFVPMPRKRLYWHNIPQVECFMANTSNIMSLQSYVGSYRKALVQRVPTLTSNVAAQRTGKTRPVEYNGVEEYLSPIDYERLLGFEPHYTDCGLTHSARIKLLGKSWSVHVVSSLLYSLRDEFFQSSNK